MPRVLVAGVGKRGAGDEAAGLIALDRMVDENWPSEIEVIDLGEADEAALAQLRRRKGAFDRLVLIAGSPRGRVPGRIYSWRWRRGDLDDDASVTRLDRILAAADLERALPSDVLLVEIEPVAVSGALSDRVLRQLPEIIRRAGRAALGVREVAPAYMV